MARGATTKTRILWVVVAVLVVCGFLYLRIGPSPAARRSQLVGTWRLFTSNPLYWHIVLREDGTGTMSGWDYEMKQEEKARDIVWSVDLDESVLSLQAVQPSGHFRGEMGGKYELHGWGSALLLDHRGGENPGTLAYKRVE
jgi:hypothetical protein